MPKIADRYLSIEPWGITENGFHQDRSRVSESLFSLGNEYVGVRGFFEEDYSGDSLAGNYVNGIYEELIGKKSYKGVSNRVCFMVNTIDWIFFRLTIDGESLDLAKSKFSSFTRSLDFRSGLLKRSLVWETKTKKKVELIFERLLSMEQPEFCHQRISLKALNFDGSAQILAGLDFSRLHEVYQDNFWDCSLKQELPKGAGILGTTRNTKQKLYAAFQLRCSDQHFQSVYQNDQKFVGCRSVQNLISGEQVVFEKTTVLLSSRNDSESALGLSKKAITKLSDGRDLNFETALENNKKYWSKVWDRSDIEIVGDEENQQGIRFSIFQLEQTFRGRVRGANIGAKGMTGEFYNGNCFWDTEVYCLPYYLFLAPDAARSLLQYRYDTLPQAIDRAKELDCVGACFPVATIDGTESCTLWQHASLQFQPTTAVAFAVWHYWKTTGDDVFMLEVGLELLLQVSRFLASRVQWSERKKAYGYYAVMGPDEFQMMVNHNAYTNFMGKRSLETTLDTLTQMRTLDPGATERVVEKVGLKNTEISDWKKISSQMYIPRENGSLIFEQHEGFFDLPHVDIKSIPAEQFPLYHSWSYDRIYRNDMIKQPDVLMFLFLYNRSFGTREKLANYEYYEPKTIHESSLSPSVHSILAAELGKEKEAVNFFRFATRIDLDNYNRNTREGLHMTAIAAAWMNIVYGFGGFRSDGDIPIFSPSLPPKWQSFTFRLRYRNSFLKLTVYQGWSEVSLLEGDPVELEIYGTKQVLGREGFCIEKSGVVRNVVNC